VIELKPLEEKDIYAVKSWRNKYYRFLRQYKLMSDKQQFDWFINLDVEKHIYYSVFEKNKIIGCVGFTYIDWRNNICELSFITENYVDVRSKKIIELSLDIVFNTWGLNKVWVMIYDIDIKKKELLEKMHFLLDGTLRKDYYANGNYGNSLIYSMLKEDYEVIKDFLVNFRDNVLVLQNSDYEKTTPLQSIFATYHNTTLAKKEYWKRLKERVLNNDKFLLFTRVGGHSATQMCMETIQELLNEENFTETELEVQKEYRGMVKNGN